MRLPFIQVAQEAFVMADTLAGLTGWDVDKSLGAILRLWKWALSRGKEDAPPDAVVRGPQAARVVAAIMRHQGDVEDFATALELAEVVERTPDGLRVKGLSRYAPAFERQQKERQRWHNRRSNSDSATTPQHSASTPAESAQAPAESLRSTPESMGQTQTQTQTQNEEEEGEAMAAALPSSSKPDGQASLLEETGSRTPPAEVLQEAWNAHPVLPRWREMPKERRRKALARLRERPMDGLEGWREVLARVAASPFCRGVNDRGWRANPDWLLRPDTAARVLEGHYDAGPPAHRGGPDSPFNPSPVAGGDVPRL